MNTKEYIESGIIESYVLGLTSAEETAELEQLSLQYPEINQAIESFAASVQQFAFDNAIPPAPEVKATLMSTLEGEFASTQSGKIVTLPKKDGSTEVVEFRSVSAKTWKYIAAAAVILFIASATINVFYYKNYSTIKDQYQALVNERNTLQVNNDTYRTRLDEANQQMKVLLNPSVNIIKMAGIKGKENDSATVYWNRQTNDVYLMINNLPQAPADKQYQLWAIVDGKPVSAGLVGDCNSIVCKLSNIPKAQAFAITLEKKGGADAPTMTAMYVLGKV